MQSNDPEALRRAEAVRQFNRFFTKHMGAQHEQLPRSEFSLTEGRILHELERGHATTAAALARNLALDSGYLSRILAAFEKRKLITRRPSDTDARQSLLALTAGGRAEYAPLDAAAIEGITCSLAHLSAVEQDQLIGAMRIVQQLLGEHLPRGIVTLREPRAGELGWLVHREAQYFAGEHGWDQRFEASLAQMIGTFAHERDAARETCWVADQEGMLVGSAFVVKASPTVARVRMLFVEPHVRQLGVGTQLLDECVRFARRAGYASIEMSLANVLDGARRLVEQAGFQWAEASRAACYGREIVLERWTRELAA